MPHSEVGLRNHRPQDQGRALHRPAQPSAVSAKHLQECGLLQGGRLDVLSSERWKAVLADGIPEEVFKTFMYLCSAGRLLFKQNAPTEYELKATDKLLKRFCHAFYTPVYAGKVERLRLCRPTNVALLGVTANLRSCGPAWSFWQLPAESLIGTRLIRSRRLPYAALTTVVSAKYSAELVTSFTQAHIADTWVEATGKPRRTKCKDPVSTFSVFKEPNVNLLPSRQAASALLGAEIARMKAVLVLEEVAEVPLHLDAEVSVAGELKTFAYIQCVRSSADRSGAYGLPE